MSTQLEHWSAHVALLPNVVDTLLATETNAIRFERVCGALYSAANQIVIVSTSRTYDRGRDGRSVSTPAQGHNVEVVICATLAEDLDDKLERDLKRLRDTTAAKHVVYCTAHSLTEHACDAMSARIKSMLPGVVSATVLGRMQLADLGMQYEEVIRKNYLAEMHEIEQTFLQVPQQGEPERVALRLALITQTGDDARELRQRLLRRLVLEALKAQGELTAAAIGSSISQQLHLGTVVNVGFVEGTLQQLREQGLVEFDGELAKLNLEGLNEATAIPKEAPKRFLEGRAAIRTAINILSGHTLTDDHYDRVWNTVMDGLAELFYSQGETMVSMVRSISGDNAGAKAPIERTHLDALGRSVAPLFASQTQGEEVGQALVDMFSEPGTPAFEWLMHLCAVYVMVCSLGLEARSGKAATDALRQLAMVVDTDIALSLLCDGEINAPFVQQLVRGWRAAGGTLLLAKPVLEEVAYHAWIAEQEFRWVKNRIAKIEDGEAYHVIANAFVRTFRKYVRDGTKIGQWHKYIGQYRGNKEYDYGNVLDMLREEYGFEELQAGKVDRKFAREVGAFVHRQLAKDKGRAPEDLDYKAQDKCRRDGLLLSDIKASRDAARGGPGRKCLVVSSSRYLRLAAGKFKRTLGPPDGVLMPGALGCLLTLIPGTHIGMKALRGVLFDTRIAAKMTSVEGYAYRLIAASGEYEVPWSKRGTLRRELGERFLADAKATGQRKSDVRDQVMRSQDPEYSARLISEALSAMAIAPDEKAELEGLRREVRELRAELRATRHSRR